MATGDVFHIALAGTYNSEPIQMTFGLVEGTGGGGPDPLADAAAAVDAALGGTTAALAGLSTGLAINQIIVHDVQPGTAPREIVNVGPHPGAASGDSLPGICAAVISWRTALRGPMNRGRIYVPGILTSDAEIGYLNSDGLDSVSGFASLLFDVFVTDGTAYQLNVLSYVPGSHPRTLRAAVPVLSFSVDNEIKSQRRRGAGVRIHKRAAP
jgi:hypothetical protein